jgi:light-regulated signal transduction histidine kinase (bacteriophytochrome)
MTGQSTQLIRGDIGARQPDRGASTGGDCCVYLNSDSLHDLFSPVNQLGTLAELMLKKYRGSLDEEAEVLFGFIQNSTNRLQNLLAGLKMYMQVMGSTSSCRPCDANALLAGAVTSIQRAIEENRAAVSHDPLPELYCDPNQISYAFASLMENAIKFRSEHQPEIHVSAAEKKNDWIFSVRDNGIGIDPRYSDRIFGMFRRIHNEGYPGAGVGLAIARQIIEQHGGRIWVESRPGRGATFFFSLPQKHATDTTASSGE